MDFPALLRNVRLWPAPDLPVSQPCEVLLRDGVVAAVGERVEAPDRCEVLDLGGRVATAGFWNCHVHLTEPVWRGALRGDWPGVQEALDDMFLSRGFVGGVDLASMPLVTRAVVRAVESGRVRGPAIVTAGGGIRPWRGIPYYIKADVPWFVRWMLPTPLTATGVRLVVAAQVAQGARVVKLFTGSYATPTLVRPMRQAVATVATRAAHRRGLKVFAHPSNREGTQVALRAGVDALAHVPDTAEGTGPLVEEAARHGIRMVPTLHMFATTVDAGEEYLGPIRATLTAFRAAGGRVLFGTDVGYLGDRDTRPELEQMGRCGMTAADALASLTTEPADFFGHTDAGRVRVGARADLTVLDLARTPETPTELADVHVVIRAGQVVWAAPSGVTSDR